jgi:hypothetical protein
MLQHLYTYGLPLCKYQINEEKVNTFSTYNPVAYPGISFGGSTNSVEGRENGHLEAAAP